MARVGAIEWGRRDSTRVKDENRRQWGQGDHNIPYVNKKLPKLISFFK